MKEYQLRVIQEREELNTKLESLTKFIETETYRQLPSDEQRRLWRQRLLMDLYGNVLTERITAFNEQ